MTSFDHERLDVYHAALEYVILVDTMLKSLPRGRAYIADQHQRAAFSIPLNIAEGAGEYSINEKGRFYRIAKRSATECVAILDASYHLGLVPNWITIMGVNCLGESYLCSQKWQKLCQKIYRARARARARARVVR